MKDNVKAAHLQGLTEIEVAQSRKQNGSNRIQKTVHTGIWRKIFENLSDPIIRILLAALVVNVIINYKHINWAECVGILISILISSLVSAFSEKGSERAFEKLSEESRRTFSRVIREGKLCRISAEDIVVGDVIFLEAGDAVPCDGRMLEGFLCVDQSALNGESAEVEKNPGDDGRTSTDRNPENPQFLFRGSLVCSGSGYFLAEAVGDHTMYGRIAEEIQTETRISPLKLRLEKLASSVAKIGYVAAILVALTYLFHVFILDSHFSSDLILSKVRDFPFVTSSLVKAVTIAVTVLVVAVPEGLPMMITVVLSSNMKRMLRDGVLVRKLVGIETAGSMNVLFTDKTGTITTGKLHCEGILDAEGELHKEYTEELKKCILIGTPCSVERGMGRKIAVQGGNATERALVSFVLREGGSPLPSSQTLPFDSRRKFSAAVGSDGVCYYKGAPEVLLPHCTTIVMDGRDQEISGMQRKNLEVLIRKHASVGERILLLAKSKRLSRDVSFPDSLVFLGAAVIRDKIRPDAVSAVRTLREAGIGTIMITGDSPDTARAIATESGILTKERNRVLRSQDLAQISDYELKSLLPHLAVVARALPQDKTRLVRVSQEMGFVVGMTGDGVNDAPALKTADVGFAMGGGTEIAKEAGDILLLKEDLAAITNATLYGRTIFSSIRKFILFQLTMNLCAVGVSLIGQLLGIDSPVTVVQMLWVNLIMDTLGGLAFAGEPPLARYLKEKPKKREEPILNRQMLWRIGMLGSFVTALCSGFLASEWVRNFYGYYQNPIFFLTAYFAVFIFAGVLLCFISRSDKTGLWAGLSKNRPFLFIMVAVILVQLGILYFGGDLFRCAPLSSRELLFAVLVSLLVLPLEMLRRFLLALGKVLLYSRKRRLKNRIPVKKFF